MASSRRRGGRVFFLLAFLLVVILGLGAGYMYLQGYFTPAQQAQPISTAAPPQDLVNIIFLNQPVPRGGIITEAVLGSVPYPRKEMIEGLFYTNLQDVVGKRAKYDLAEGIPLTSTMLSDVKEGSYASFQIPRGMVAISIPISRLTSVSYALQPGDHVNVIASMLLVNIDPSFQSVLPNRSAPVTKPSMPQASGAEGTTTPPTEENAVASIKEMGGILGRTEIDPVLNLPIYLVPSEAQRPRLITQNIIQDAIVLWVGNAPENGTINSNQPVPTPTPNPDGSTPQAAPRPDVISLIVSPQDSAALNYLILSGAQLNLTLRSAGDDQRVATEPITLQFIMDQYNIPFPPNLPYDTATQKKQLDVNQEVVPVATP